MRKREERPVGDWPVGEPQRETETVSEPGINRLSAFVHSWIVKGLSNLRLSLTLRISLHYAWQLIRTTLLVATVLFGVMCACQAGDATRAMDALSLQTPEAETRFTQEQLRGTPFEEAWLSDIVLEEGLPGMLTRCRLFFSKPVINNHKCVMLYVDTPTGSLAAAYRITELLRMMKYVLVAFVLMDLFRVLYFIHHRNGLNRKVLKPISDMADTAAKLSANNLSDRISVEGAKNELKDLALVINGMLDRIEVSYNSQKQFVSDASHELRTPIAVIQGYVNMLNRWGKEDPEVLSEGLSAIAQETTSMKELVERLLFLARHDKKTLMLEMERFDPLEVMSEIHREAKMLSSEHTFALDPAQNALVNGDKDMIKQLMRILLDNAIKYTPVGGSITLGVRKDRTHCILTVSDTGVGISAEDMPKVFERFYRCDSSRKAQTSGHGLGLSIARIIVTAHGGELKVRSKLGVGTTFSVLLPLEEDRNG